MVDAQGAICHGFKVKGDPDAMAAAPMFTGLTFGQIGLEAGPLSQWLHAGLTKADVPVALLGTRQLRASVKVLTTGG